MGTTIATLAKPHTCLLLHSQTRKLTSAVPLICLSPSARSPSSPWRFRWPGRGPKSVGHVVRTVARASGQYEAEKKYYMLEYNYVPDIMEKRTPHRPGHLALCQKLSEEGNLLLGGAREEPLDGAWLLFHVADRKAIEDFIQSDPYIAAGLVTGHRIRPWTVVVGNAKSPADNSANAQENAQINLTNRLVSMSGFARVEGSWENVTWVWEVKSVNGKSLNVSPRSPYAYSFLDQMISQAVADRCARGSINVNLEVKTDKSTSEANKLTINEAAVEQILASARSIRASSAKNKSLTWGGLPEDDLTTSDVLRLMRINGVVQNVQEEESEEAKQAKIAAMSRSLREAVDQLVSSRASEGGRLKEVLTTQIDELAALAEEANQAAEARLSVVKEKLKQTATDLLQNFSELDSGRLEQELAIQAAKLDVREEIERLRSHVAGTRDLMNGVVKSRKGSADSSDSEKRGLVVGRQLDFLSQEMFREANTLAAKANDLSLTQVALQLKIAIDQFKEQVANVQ